MFWSLFTSFLFAIDFKFKEQVESMSDDKFPIDICSGKITLHKSHNYGLAFGFLSNSPTTVIFTPLVVTINVLSTFISLMSKSGQPLKKFGISLVTAGGIGNLYDRLKRGYVVDYFSFNCKKLTKLKNIIFNLSDIFIFVGTLILLLAELKSSGKNKS